MGSTIGGPGASGGRQSRRGRAIRPAVIGALALGVLTIVGVSVSAAQSSGPTTSTPSSTTPTTAPSSGYARGGFRGHGFGPGGLGGFGSGAIHGEFVRPNGSGYQTVDVQVGHVTTVSSSSITLKSVDGFTKTYSVDTNTLVNAGRDGIGTVKVNDSASVQAVVNGKSASAASIIDSTTLGSLRQHWRPVPPPSSPTSPTTTP